MSRNSLIKDSSVSSLLVSKPRDKDQINRDLPSAVFQMQYKKVKVRKSYNQKSKIQMKNVASLKNHVKLRA